MSTKTVTETTINGKTVNMIYIKESETAGGTITGKYTCGRLVGNTSSSPGTWEEAKEGRIGAGPEYDENIYSNLNEYAVKLAADKEGLTITGNFVPVDPE
jgi:hypothetical protein